MHVTYDDGSSVYFNTYQMGWGSAYNVSSSTGLSENRDASVERSGSGSGHVAWRARSDALQARGIAYRRRYANGYWSSGYSFFYQSMNEYHQPSVTGHAGEKCSIVWYNNSNTIMKVYYNGTSWEGPTQVAGNGKYPNLSAGSTTAKFCWTSGSSSPYEIKVSSGTFQRPLLLARPEVPQGSLSFERSRVAVLEDTTTGALFWAQMGNVRVKTRAGGEILIPLVSYVDSLLVLDSRTHFDYLRTEPMTLPLDADSLKLDILVYTRGCGAFKPGGAGEVEVEYKLVDASTGLPLLSVRRVPVVEKAGEFHTQCEVAIDLRSYHGRRVFIAVEAKGLGEGAPHILRNLGEIYRIVEGSFFGRPPEGKELTQTQPTSFALSQNYPNPATHQPPSPSPSPRGPMLPSKSTTSWARG